MLKFLSFLFIADMAFATTIVTVKPVDFKAELEELKIQGFDVAGIDLEQGTVDVVLPDNAVDYFKTVINKNVIHTQTLAAPDTEYKTPDKVSAALRDYASRYPGQAVPVIVGASVENRLIHALKISNNVIYKSNKKKTVLFNAMHHAREIMTPEIILDMIDYLLTKSNEPQVKDWLDNLEIWAVPMLNVDGNNKVWSGSSMWRKNTKNGYGVDLNRNYPHKWGTCNGSSGSTSSDVYRGPSAGSEPETQALMNLVGMIKPLFNISYHSYSEIVIYPEGCQGSRLPDSVRSVYEGHGKTLASKLVRDSGSGTYTAGTSWELLYATDGTDIDWMFHTHGVMSYVIEVNSSNQGFQPSYQKWRDATVEKQRPGWMYILDEATKAAKNVR